MSNIDNNKKITKVKLSKKFVKGIDDDLILPTINWDDFLENNWCYIYPNGGTAENPANIVANSRYVLDNPFPDYMISAVTELYNNNTWGEMKNLIYYVSGSSYSQGIITSIYDNKIIIRTGSTYLYGGSIWDGNPFNSTNGYTSLPCRVKVYKIGKIKR